MIWEWIMRQAVDLIEWVAAQVAAVVPPVPDWLVALPGYIHTLTSYLGAVGHWFPVELLAVVVLAVALTWAAGLAIKGFRIVASFLTLGGGGAG